MFNEIRTVKSELAQTLNSVKLAPESIEAMQYFEMEETVIVRRSLNRAMEKAITPSMCVSGKDPRYLDTSCLRAGTRLMTSTSTHDWTDRKDWMERHVVNIAYSTKRRPALRYSQHWSSSQALNSKHRGSKPRSR